MLCKLLLLCANFFQFPSHENFGIYKNYLFTLCLETFFFLVSSRIYFYLLMKRETFGIVLEKRKRKKEKMQFTVR